MKRVHITFPCGDFQLEGCWHLPEGTVPYPAVVVCHPHPLHGGDMNNNVVFAICQALAARDIAALRFNFRRVGQSGGEYGEGVGEREDVRAALSLAATNPDVDSNRLGLAGYSFGGHVAVPVAAGSESVKRLVLIAPYLTDPEWPQLQSYNRPFYIIHGESDFVISTDSVRHYLGDGLSPEQYEVIKGADHYLMGYETLVAEKVVSFFTDGLKSG